MENHRVRADEMNEILRPRTRILSAAHLDGDVGHHRGTCRRGRADRKPALLAHRSRPFGRPPRLSSTAGDGHPSGVGISPARDHRLIWGSTLLLVPSLPCTPIARGRSHGSPIGPKPSQGSYFSPFTYLPYQAR